MDEPKFSKNESNPLTEFAELRLEVMPDQDDFNVSCQLRFSTAEVSFKDREYSVGITEARLQLQLEGCETVIGYDFGDEGLTAYTEETSSTVQKEIWGGVGVSVSLEGIAVPSLSVGAKAENKHEHTIQTNKIHLPMKALPNGAWRVKSLSAKSKDAEVLDGTAMRGERLCRLRRKSGSNRLSLAAELQVRRSNIKVVPTKGNARGKMFSLKRNKDAVVAKVLEQAIRREASTIPQGQLENTVAVSKSEVTEE